MKLKKFNDEVYYLEDEVTHLTPEIVDFLKSKAVVNERRRCRICTHRSPEDAMHEMFIMHMRGNYVPAHCHRQGDESLTALMGEAAMIYFGEEGDVTEVFYLDAAQNSGVNYVRTPKNKLHSLFIESEFFLFKETTLGPFSPDNMFEPDWIANGYVEAEFLPFMERSQELFNEAKLTALSKK